MFSARSRILHWAQQGLIEPKDVETAMHMGGVLPDAGDWRRFIERMLLGLGILSIAIGIVFFIAYNWHNFGKFGKFALVEGVLLLSVSPIVRYEPDSRIGRYALTGASIVVGALWALFGQIYQTGADTWELFAVWGISILPWVVWGRFVPLWLLWVAIVNVSVALYFGTRRFDLFDLFWSYRQTLLALFVFNLFVLGIREFLRPQRFDGSRYFARIVATVIAIVATFLGLDAVTSVSGSDNAPIVSIWIVWFVAQCALYRVYIRDLYMLSLGCFSVLIVGITWLGRVLLDAHMLDAGVFFLLALVLIVAAALTATWLRKTARDWERADG